MQEQDVELCKGCKHSLKDNLHGIDQNDIYEKPDGTLGWDSSIYCKECNPWLTSSS